MAGTVTARGWLSTWSAPLSKAKMADTMPTIKVPTLLIHPTADTEIAPRGASDGYRPEVLNIVAEWLKERFP